MNKCTDSAIRESLPDLLHETLAAEAKGRVEAHLATCESCKEDLKVLSTIQSAAVFAPTIDVDRVVRQIPPYRTIVPAVEVPTRSRRMSWLVAATLAIAFVGGGSLVVMRENVPSGSTAVVVPSGSTGVLTTQPQAPALALAADVDGLSDGDLALLMDEMNGFDALPASEPDPVISVDNGDTSEQD
jgi:anti-sigma factor RsiW